MIRKKEEYLTDKGIVFFNKLHNSFIEIDKALKNEQQVTPTPDWTKNPSYKLKIESELEKSITSTTDKINKLNLKLNKDKVLLEKESYLRRLLFEKGKILEAEILEALKIIGFEAEGYEDEESEFDAVFISEEGRFIGEAEGKDNKAIDIRKLSQLERQLQEDYARDEVDEYAKGVLFGNAYRLTIISEREEFFTKKCISGAQRSGIALVRTPDLFLVAKYIKESQDVDFAKKCREKIAETKGEIVKFPEIPTVE